jgi:hypothetical protein
MQMTMRTLSIRKRKGKWTVKEIKNKFPDLAQNGQFILWENCQEHVFFLKDKKSYHDAPDLFFRSIEEVSGLIVILRKVVDKKTGRI